MATTTDTLTRVAHQIRRQTEPDDAALLAIADLCDATTQAMDTTPPAVLLAIVTLAKLLDLGEDTDHG